ncbi:chemotaxis response regulator protein-glutamate methylesterase [Halobacillus sp. A1]|uniref:protein-glutamate methylesterase/protein-glutamine glutaminase n=1 Tax=Halobacillus sp. A1 TaxID=2880262 RepID=UPI0020A67001|nr:chemotaxis response regulator protein-glutamate methylesterase [Halobacillus sp. A1]MCP3031214.1 chemotaxis response regulator protein-glutamate methylesterase [Halobacillus sp. A1]
MHKIKVLVVDDSAFMRKMLSEILNADIRIEVVGTARDGSDGISKAEALKPDVMTLDIEMPKMDGLEALKILMRENPLPVVMVSSLTAKGADSTIKAMELGAVDFVLKPSGSISLDIHKVEHSIVRKVIAVSKSKMTATVTPACPPLLTTKIKNNKDSIIAIGTSTGGPRALQKVIGGLPADLNVPVLVVQHMPARFTSSLAKRLNGISSAIVKEAVHAEVLENGVVYIAPGDFHMGVIYEAGTYKVHLENSDPIIGHRPSVNHLFESLSHLDLHTVAAVMTGMGADGTEGLIKMKKRNSSCYVIAESEETSIVFGMPKAVIKSKLANEVAPVNKISESIMQAISRQEGASWTRINI